MSNSLRIASWNINSVRIRLPLIGRFCREAAPDVLCLQETKVEDTKFPMEGVRDLGFEHIYFSGEKSYNGVAILSRFPLSEVRSERWAGVDDRRHIAATLPDGTELHNFYVPAGGDVPDPEVNPKFAHKLRFLDDMTAWAEQLKNQRAIILGDFNIAPLEQDVWSHKQLLNVVSHTPIEVDRLTGLRETLGWIDTHRSFVPKEEKLYSWWSYRARDWKKANRGRRLDHIWLTPALAPSLKSAAISAHARGWDSPSDHVPVFIDIAG